ncbi:MAG: hypothetical protein IKO68_10970 [Oscillospiraceae bacterium]|nr:hypothetical protein [Oscillospiraceae bacterium]MBR3241066.1 hypothetical protein [Oscillospiraceae bacterium]MBR4657054.1 hypothetical protein [Oscillospiraceae bacterium]
MALRWYDLRGPGGTITIKERSETAAKAEAAERWACGSDEIICVGHDAFGRQLVSAPEYSR